MRTEHVNYLPLDVVIERADGCWVYDVEGTLRSSVIKEVRSRGLWIAIELNTAARKDCEALKEGRALQGNPRTHYSRGAPLVIQREEIDWAVERFQKVLA
jgi:ornithine--oxo-acid transaminase